TLEAHGLVPDWIVIPTRKTLLASGDPQLAAGIQKLRERIASTRMPELVAEVKVSTPPDNQPKPLPSESAQRLPPPGPAPLPDEKSPSSQNLAATKQIIEKYIAAVGGERAFLKLTNRISTGTVQLPGVDASGGTIEIYEEASGRWTLLMNIEGLGTVRHIFDGKVHWMQHPLEGLVTYPTSDLANENTFQKLAVKAIAPWLRFSGIEKVGGKDALVLSREIRGGGVDKLFFDVATGLLVRRNGVYYEDYREVDGVKLPFTTREESTYGFVVFRMNEIKHNVPIDQNRFQEVSDCFTAPGKGK
ncbi:MAG: photosynthetic reaction center cytochrome c subunit, partial [Acidimicrobiaceae bacterium]|nr:photosynthetic reaction center cytochrome c subunit [Acidimicrobiaceae bacterium]